MSGFNTLNTVRSETASELLRRLPRISYTYLKVGDLVAWTRDTGFPEGFVVLNKMGTHITWLCVGWLLGPPPSYYREGWPSNSIGRCFSRYETSGWVLDIRNESLQDVVQLFSHESPWLISRLGDKK